MIKSHYWSSRGKLPVGFFSLFPIVLLVKNWLEGFWNLKTYQMRRDPNLGKISPPLYNIYFLSELYDLSPSSISLYISRDCVLNIMLQS